MRRRPTRPRVLSGRGGLLLVPFLASALAAQEGITPVLPWDPGGWPARSWLGLCLELVLFLLAAAVILRAGSSPAVADRPEA